MENNQDIDKRFNDASKLSEEPAVFPGFDEVWAKVEEKLDKKEEKKKTVPVWFPYGIAASLIIGLGVFYFLDKKDTTAPVQPVLVEKTKDNLPKDHIQAIDSTVKSNIEKEIAVPKSLQNKSGLAYENNKTPGVIGNSAADHKSDEIYASRKAEYSTDESFIKKQDQTVVTTSQRQGGQRKDTLREQNIEEVVLTGLAPKKKVAYTSSSAVVSTQSNYIASNTSQALQGTAAGIQVQAYGIKRSSREDSKNTLNMVNSGYLNNSNNNNQIVIRGAASLNGNNEPLYVVNGMVVERDYFNSLNPKKIKSVEVLKDAAASALYGGRAMNGVVVVNTNKLSRKEKRRMEKIQKAVAQYKQNPVSDNEGYDAFVENPFELTKNQPLSTFSIDVDNAAYSNVRRMINNGQTVDKNAVRIEEMINYFKYNYPQPKNNDPFSINTEYSDAPWNPDHKLLKIGLQGKNVAMDKLPPSNLVFLVDVSGSMNEPNKLPLLKSSFKVLLDQLRPEDKVGIVVYAGSAGMVLSPTSAKEKEKIISALDNLQAGGSTAGGAGIELAYKLAQENFVKDGNNRVIIATDGDFNVGASSTSDIKTLIEEKRKSGVFLTCLGFGMGNYKDNTLETLANKGNGNYAYIDNLQEANKFLGKEFAGSIYAIAKDVKIQIEFNPKYVSSYRLIGYENRKLRNEDFTNDKIDAGELGSGHTVTALYEVIPAHVKSEFLPEENQLKYNKTSPSENFSDELATVKFRYKKPDADTSREIVQTVKNEKSKAPASPDFKFASSVAWFGLVLRQSNLIRKKDLSEIENLAKQGKANDEEGYRSEFIRLIESYKAVSK
ncbi:von Willebrand factor type A domain-containing protein [Chryseobacterium sp. L7]|uniref:von Willebrand factor type A domain-containing protein n=1 Tax=Chryseobacterium endalhagicum TaxID=2797638 RepID=A0ABS1QCJ6_9FLAO|nr:VWA domain-containing protein [Chryseobacterium endalhagicum]MBL1220338.1 von Willebrand factor type A domain-containing protein [Chryseobacterium endalhagicum]